MDDFSFSLLVQLVRIHEACRRLKDSDTPITLISFYTGFCDSAHFAREFRACTGMTPSRYRAFIQNGSRKTASTGFGGPE
jgi:AraC-like DNA-binding protein